MDKTIGERFAQATAAERDRGFRVEMAELRALVDSDTTHEVDGNAGMLGGNGETPLKPPTGPRRRYVRDLLGPPVPCGRIVRYVAEQITSEQGGATSVAEAAAKPETSFKLAWGELTAGKIAVWVPMTGEVAEDAPGLAAWIDGRLAEQLGSAEDDQLINGNGTGANLKGFLSWPNIQTQTATNNDVFSTIGDAIAKVEAKGTTVDGIVINPADYWAARTERRSTVFDDSLPLAPSGDIFGVPTVRSTKIAAGTALVGAFRLGATLREHSPVTIRTSTSHSTYFVSNKLVVLAEVEEALTLHVEDYFVAVAIDTTA